MSPEDVKNYYKSMANFIRETGFTERTFYLWRRKGIVPAASQVKLNHLSNGHLKINIQAFENRASSDFFIEHIEIYKNYNFSIILNNKSGHRHGFIELKTESNSYEAINCACKHEIDQLENKNIKK